MTESRVAKSMKNTVFGLIGLIVSLVSQFVARSIFIAVLGAEYNGVNGLFSNILQVLNLAELGFAYAIAFALYKPLQNGDERTISAIMNYLAKIYRIVAIVVAAAGCLCIPFLQHLISEDISELSFNLMQLRIYFAIYLLNTVFSYVFASKRTIITADQKSYLVSNVDNLGTIALNIVQIVLLLIFRNYYVFLTVMVVKTIATNVILTNIANKKYPFLRKNGKLHLEKNEKSDIVKNVEAMFCHKLGSVAVYSTTTIIISAFVSIIDAGLYSNYIMIVSAVNMFINIIFNSLTASVGNLCVEADKEHQYTVFKRISYISNFLTVFSLVCYVCLFNGFISLWLGEDMLLGFPIVVAISFNAVLGTIRTAVGTFKNAQGLFKKDWYKPILETVFGVGFAIGFSFIWGTFGVILGYIISTIFIAIPIENIVLYKYGLNKPVRYQFLSSILTIVLAAGLTALTYFLCSFLPEGIGWFILRALICVLISCVFYFGLTFKTQEFIYYKNLGESILKKLLCKRSNDKVDRSD